MKHLKIYRILGVAVILALLVVAMPVNPARAATIIVSPNSGETGDTIQVIGSGLNEDSTHIIYMTNDITVSIGDDIDDQITTYQTVRTLETDSSGNFNTTFIIPTALTYGTYDADVTSGSYRLCITNPDFLPNRIIAYTNFTVTGGGEIEIDPEEGTVDTEVEITGTGFPANEDIDKIEFDGDEVDIEDGDEDTDSDGEFSTFILIPESDAGDQTITVTIGSSEAEATFTVEPEIVLSVNSGKTDDEVTISGTGFGRRNDVTIYFRNVGVATKETSSRGSFSATFTVPDLAAGIYDIEAEDEDENLDTTKFTVFVPSEPVPDPDPTPEPTPEPTPSPTSGTLSPTDAGAVSTDLVISGTGFEASKKVTVKYDGEEVSTATSTSAGILIAAFKVPVSKSGEHTVTASDGTNTLELTFTVESDAPKTPTPLLPEMGIALKSPISFDWADVTDASLPTTYSLQVATDRDFETSSLVLEKELTKSEYTFTEAEETDISGQETPYYWRVKAIDAASNEGAWTGAGEFYITTPFSIPSWALYTLIGLGGLLLFAIGYWLGRRTAFYY
ncbi:IPT/TIG domain-containing protein [Chloroflexota bacterium]